MKAEIWKHVPHTGNARQKIDMKKLQLFSQAWHRCSFLDKFPPPLGTCRSPIPSILIAVSELCSIPVAQRKAFWVFSCRMPPGCKWRKSGSEGRKGSLHASAGLSVSKKDLNFLLLMLHGITHCPRYSPSLIWLTFIIKGFITVSVFPCNGVTATLLSHRLCESSATLLTVIFTLPARSTRVHHWALAAEFCTYRWWNQTEGQANFTPPPTSYHTSFCLTSPSLVAVTFHAKIFASLAQRQLVNWQPGQASTFSSGVSMRVVCTWVRWGAQTYIGIELAPGNDQRNKHHESQKWGCVLCPRYQYIANSLPLGFYSCSNIKYWTGKYSLGYSPRGSWRQWLSGWKPLLVSQSMAETDLQRKAGRP